MSKMLFYEDSAQCWLSFQVKESGIATLRKFSFPVTVTAYPFMSVVVAEVTRQTLTLQHKVEIWSFSQRSQAIKYNTQDTQWRKLRSVRLGRLLNIP